MISNSNAQKKARPILFSTAMVQALLLGNKTQTRRTIGKFEGKEVCNLAKHELYNDLEEPFSGEINDPESWGYPAMIEYDPYTLNDMLRYKLCPYGKVGDLLWVRETFINGKAWRESIQRTRKLLEKWPYGAVEMCEDKTHEIADALYKADEQQYIAKWKPSIHMPRWASRITLEITNIRVERLQSITENDAIAEGLEKISGYGPGNRPQEVWKCYTIGQSGYHDPIPAYQSLWESINGSQSWRANPWVWVVEFKVHKCNVDTLLLKSKVV